MSEERDVVKTLPFHIWCEDCKSWDNRLLSVSLDHNCKNKNSDDFCPVYVIGKKHNRSILLTGNKPEIFPETTFKIFCITCETFVDRKLLNDKTGLVDHEC